jgi:hypothetical protein
MYTHTCTHTHMQTEQALHDLRPIRTVIVKTYTHTHTCTHSHMYTHTCRSSKHYTICAPYAQKSSKRYVHTHTCTHPRMYTHTHMQIEQTYMLTHTCTHTHTHMQIEQALHDLRPVRTEIVKALRNKDKPAPSQSSKSHRSSSSSKSQPKAGLGAKFRRLKSGLFEITEVKTGGGAAASGKVRIGDRCVYVFICVCVCVCVCVG